MQRNLNINNKTMGNKETITIRIKPDSRKKLDGLRAELGLSYGSVIDLLLDNSLSKIILDKNKVIVNTFEKD